MSKSIFIVFCALILGGCTIQPSWDKKPGGLHIESEPVAEVSIDNKVVGTTPYKNDNIKAGEHTLKLTPTGSVDLIPWETKLKLNSAATTIIKRKFSPLDIDVESSVLQFQPEIGKTKAYFSIVSDPDTVNVTLDGKPIGFTPLSKIESTPTDHVLLISSPGYHEKTLSVRLNAGYNLIINVKLAGQSITLASPTPTPTPLGSVAPSASPIPSSLSFPSSFPKPYIVVVDTPDTKTLGGINVRSLANSTSEPLGLAKIGEKLVYLGETTSAGWHKVTFEDNPGWVSGKYTNLVK